MLLYSNNNNKKKNPQTRLKICQWNILQLKNIDTSFQRKKWTSWNKALLQGNGTYMAAFTTAEKPNIKYHCELNPVKFRPLEQNCEIHYLWANLHRWLQTRFVSGEEDVQTQAAQKQYNSLRVQICKFFLLPMPFQCSLSIKMLTRGYEKDSMMTQTAWRNLKTKELLSLVLFFWFILQNSPL